MAATRAEFDNVLRKRLANNFYTQLNDDQTDQDGDSNKESKPTIKRKPYTLENLCWLVASVAVFYYTDFPKTVLYDDRVKRMWFNMGAFMILINITIALFLILWLSVVKKMSSDDWDIQYPAAIPVATGTFIFGSICILVSLWPVFGVFTPVVLLTLLMGFVVVIAMLPAF